MFLGNDLLVSGLMNSTSRLGRMNLNELFLAPSVGPCRGSPSVATCVSVMQLCSVGPYASSTCTPRNFFWNAKEEVRRSGGHDGPEREVGEVELVGDAALDNG
jgi:hypothetical protein